jgi:hypothetical protein
MAASWLSQRARNSGSVPDRKVDTVLLFICLEAVKSFPLRRELKQTSVGTTQPGWPERCRSVSTGSARSARLLTP